MSCSGDEPEESQAPTSTSEVRQTTTTSVTTPRSAGGALVAPTPSTTASTDPATEAAGSLSDFRSCGGRAECAELTVPLDWSEPDGPTTTVPVTRVPATGDRLGVLLVNPGGPGVPGSSYVTSIPVSDELAERFDLIGWDPRGTGGSTLLDCDEALPVLWGLDSSPDDAGEQAELDAAAAAVGRDCAATHGPSLSFVDSESTVSDMDALRAALGEAEINYLGFSYGTYLGLRYLDRYPDRVRAMALDGVVDPDQDLETFLSGQVTGLRATFDEMVRSCTSSCPVEDLDRAIDQVVAAVEADQLGGGSRGLSESDLGTAIIQASYSPNSWDLFYRAVSDAADGDGSGLRALADSYHSSVNFPAYLAITCADNDRPTTAAGFAELADRLRAQDELLGATVANEVAPCGSWPVPPLAAHGDVTAPAAPPVLVIGNTGDQATPYVNAVEVADELARGVLLTYEGQGHLSYSRSGCVRAATDAYLVGLDQPGDGATC